MTIVYIIQENATHPKLCCKTKNPKVTIWPNISNSIRTSLATHLESWITFKLLTMIYTERQKPTYHFFRVTLTKIQSINISGVMSQNIWGGIIFARERSDQARGSVATERGGGVWRGDTGRELFSFFDLKMCNLGAYLRRKFWLNDMYYMGK